MKSLTRDVLAELALNYRVQNVFEPQHSAGIWGISFFDRYAPPGHHVFQIAVGPVDEATLSLTKTELLAKLSERRSISPASLDVIPRAFHAAMEGPRHRHVGEPTRRGRARAARRRRRGAHGSPGDRHGPGR